MVNKKVNKLININKHIIIFLLDENKVLAGGAGTIEVVTGAIKNNIGSADVCKYGCWTLKNIIINGK